MVVATSGTDPKKWKVGSSGKNDRIQLRLSLHNGYAKRCEAALIKRNAPKRVGNENADMVKHRI